MTQKEREIYKSEPSSVYLCVALCDALMLHGVPQRITEIHREMSSACYSFVLSTLKSSINPYPTTLYFDPGGRPSFAPC